MLMISFLEKTWLLWWLLASLVVLRWFQGISVVEPMGARDSSDRDNSQFTVPGQLASRT
jgi:hypothetical protein